MADYVIEAEPRTALKRKNGQLRRQGFVPGTVYGPKIQPMTIQIPYRALDLLLRKAGGTNLIDLKVKKETYTVLAREVQRDVIKGTILHIDFFAVDESSPIRVSIPLHVVGTSPVVESRLGILMTGANKVMIETLPRNLRNRIDVDISTLVNLGDSITIGDLDLGEGISIFDDPGRMVVRVVSALAMLAAEEEEEKLAEGEAAGEEGAEPEVITKGKGEEEEED